MANATGIPMRMNTMNAQNTSSIPGASCVRESFCLTLRQFPATLLVTSPLILRIVVIKSSVAPTGMLIVTQE
jgi:hypothetical protein